MLHSKGSFAFQWLECSNLCNGILPFGNSIAVLQCYPVLHGVGGVAWSDDAESEEEKTDLLWHKVIAF